MHSHKGEDGVAMVCSACAPKAGGYTGQPPTNFVGKLVKLAFRAIEEDGRETKEHMWVHALEVEAGNTMRGELLNTPIFKMDFQLGDMVAFKVSEIEQVAEMPARPKGN